MNLASIRFGVSGGAPLPNEVRTRFTDLTGCALVEGYGLTEAGAGSELQPAGRGGEGRLGGAAAGGDGGGDPRPGRSGPAVCAVGERGEVCVRGAQVMAGYWNRPGETAAAFIDGALRTGDVGYLDEDGYLFLVDRIKDVILCGGYNVYPRMLEEALYQHPAVLEATVIGIPDPYRGEAPKAFVVLRAGHEVSPDVVAELHDGVCLQDRTAEADRDPR